MPSKTTSRRSPSKESEMLQQTQLLLAWSAYQESLREVDQKALQQFQMTVNSLRMALWIRVSLYILQFVVATVVLFIALFQVNAAPSGNYTGLGILAVSFVLLIILLFRNPIQSMNGMLVDLARVQIILQGYTRQINQIDATFKQAFLEKKVELKTVSKSLAEVQKVIDGNIESLLQFMEETHI